MGAYLPVGAHQRSTERTQARTRFAPPFRSMRIVLKGRLMAVLGVSVMACGPKQVEVRTAPTQTAGPSVQVSNRTSQPVNVYVTISGTDTYLGQVGANGSQTLAIPGLAPGTSVNLKAVAVDGTHTYSRNNVALTGQYLFSVP